MRRARSRTGTDMFARGLVDLLQMDESSLGERLRIHCDLPHIVER